MDEGHRNAVRLNGAAFASAFLGTASYVIYVLKVLSVRDAEGVVDFALIPPELFYVCAIASGAFMALSFIFTASALSYSKAGTFIASFAVTMIGFLMSAFGSLFIFYIMNTR